MLELFVITNIIGKINLIYGSTIVSIQNFLNSFMMGVFFPQGDDFFTNSDAYVHRCNEYVKTLKDILETLVDHGQKMISNLLNSKDSRELKRLNIN